MQCHAAITIEAAQSQQEQKGPFLGERRPIMMDTNIFLDRAAAAVGREKHGNL